MNTERKAAWNTYYKLSQLLKALPERAMRREVFGEFAHSLTAVQLAEVLYLVVRESSLQDGAKRILLAFQDQQDANTVHRMDYKKVKEIYRVSREKGYLNVQRLFFTSLPQKEENEPLSGHHHLSRTTLGMRKAMARQYKVEELERLLLDPEPSVIRILLDSRLR